MANKLDQAKELLGELILTGFSGTQLSDETSAFLSQAKIGGVVLFTPNYENPEQIAELIHSIQECRTGDLPLWITVDYEGGRVQRFKSHFTKIPEPDTVAKKDSPKLTFEISEMMAKELASVGINVNFAPVADINSNPKNPVIGTRSFGSSEDQVSKMVTAFVRGHLAGGVAPCVKHFPGHGDTTVDSHFALPTVNDKLESLRDREFRPFQKGFKSGCRFVMTAHIMNPNIDPKFPATFSKTTLQGILREELRYTGIIISDDMEMKAVTDTFGAEEAPRLAIEAGCDLLCYRSEKAARHAYTSLLKALEDGKLSPERVIDAAQRSQEYKKDFLGEYEPVEIRGASSRVGTPENLDLVKKIVG